MSLQELLAEIPRLTMTERIMLLEVVTKTLKDEFVPNTAPTPYRGSPAEKMRGIIKFPNGHIPDDKEIDELRWQALQEKYLQ